MNYPLNINKKFSVLRGLRQSRMEWDLGNSINRKYPGRRDGECGRSPDQKNLETSVIIEVHKISKLLEDRIENLKKINTKKHQVDGAAGGLGAGVAPQQTHPACGPENKQPVRLHWDARAGDQDW